MDGEEHFKAWFLWGAKYLHTRDIGKLKKYVCMIFFFLGGGHLGGGTENLWGARTPGPPPPP